MKTRDDAKIRIRDKALALGFDTIGFAPADLDVRTVDEFNAYLAAGHHGDMDWLAAKQDRRAGPRHLWDGANAVISLGLSYAPAGDPLAALDNKEHGTISVYAQGRDYHDVMKKRLKALARWIHETWDAQVKIFVDTAPVMEKPLAQMAGIGWQGKHTNLVSQSFGSWLFLGEIYTELDLEPDDEQRDLCGTCRRCQDICPTAAFPSPYKLDARRCISYLTIEHHGPIDRELRPLMGNRIYGCDDCLAVCPWNKFAKPTDEPDFLARAELTAPRLKELAALGDADFRTLFSGSAVKRMGRDRFVRNVLIAIGNSGEPGLAQAALARLEDDAPVVRGAAIWALAQLVSADAFLKFKSTYAPAECDAEVLAEWEVYT